MTLVETSAAVAVAEIVSRELDEDLVGLWVLAWHLHRRLPLTSDERIREISEVILRGLAESKVSIGYLSGESGIFTAWPRVTPLSGLCVSGPRLDVDPNIGEVAWLARQHSS